MVIDINTIGKLRAYIDLIESGWTDQDTEVLGTFDDQAIAAWTDGGGYAPANITVNEGATLIVGTEHHYKAKEQPMTNEEPTGAIIIKLTAEEQARIHLAAMMLQLSPHEYVKLCALKMANKLLAK